MKKLLIPFACISFLLACNNSSQTGSSGDSAASSAASTPSSNGGESDTNGSGGPTGSSADSVTRCYMYAANKDTIRMKLIQTGQNITGELNYSLSEKDANTGTINGMLRGDTLIADYSYKSEGKVSMRQEVMLRQGDGFTIGSGATRSEDGKQVFSDLGKLNFGKLKLALTNCNE